MLMLYSCDPGGGGVDAAQCQRGGGKCARRCNHSARLTVRAQGCVNFASSAGAQSSECHFPLLAQCCPFACPFQGCAAPLACPFPDCTCVCVSRPCPSANWACCEKLTAKGLPYLSPLCSALRGGNWGCVGRGCGAVSRLNGVLLEGCQRSLLGSVWRGSADRVVQAD